MSKIVNLRMKNKKIATSIGTIEFDANGLANIENEEYVSSLIELDGFELADGEKMPEKAIEEPKAEEDSDVEGNTQEDEEENINKDELTINKDELTEEVLSMKNVPQLRKIAKDNNIDLAGASKKDELIAVILGSVNQ